MVAFSNFSSTPMYSFSNIENAIRQDNIKCAMPKVAFEQHGCLVMFNEPKRPTAVSLGKGKATEEKGITNRGVPRMLSSKC